MKKIMLLTTVLIAFVLSSCKKDKNNKNHYTIGYTISPMNAFFTKIRYTNSAGQAVEITDPNMFSNGTVSFDKPAGSFKAKFSISSDNNTAASLYFTIVIDSSQQAKSYKSISVSPYQQISDSIEYTFN